MIRLMVRASISMLMVRGMKVIGKMIYRMGMVLILGLMVQNMMDTIKRGKSLDMVNMSGQMGQDLRAIGEIIRLTVRELTILVMVEFIMANGLII